MSDLKKVLKSAIIAEYGTVEKWASSQEVLSSRFYNFLKGTYNPTYSTLEGWLESVGLEISAKKNNKANSTKKT